MSTPIKCRVPLGDRHLTSGWACHIHVRARRSSCRTISGQDIVPHGPCHPEKPKNSLTAFFFTALESNCKLCPTISTNGWFCAKVVLKRTPGCLSARFYTLLSHCRTSTMERRAGSPHTHFTKSLVRNLYENLFTAYPSFFWFSMKSFMWTD